MPNVNLSNNILTNSLVSRVKQVKYKYLKMFIILVEAKIH